MYLFKIICDMNTSSPLSPRLSLWYRNFTLSGWLRTTFLRMEQRGRSEERIYSYVTGAQCLMFPNGIVTLPRPCLLKLLSIVLSISSFF